MLKSKCSILRLSYFVGLLGFFSFESGSTAWAETPSQLVKASEENCLYYAGKISQVTNDDYTEDCIIGYAHDRWPNENFSNSLIFYKRLSELRPNDFEVFDETLFIWFSNYAEHYRNNPSNPDLPKEVNEVLRFSEARFSNPRWKGDPNFYFIAARFFLSLATHKDTQEAIFWGMHYLQKADHGGTRIGDLELVWRSRMALGNIYRTRANPDLARFYYWGVLEVNPGREAAKRYLDDLNKSPALKK